VRPVSTRSGASAPARLSRPERVAEAIKQFVVDEGLAPGDRLPGEADLIARFGMAKSTIREAMRILEAQGLVKTRTGPGGGTFVHEVSRTRARALLANYFYFKNLTIADIYQLRRALEPELAASLAGRLDDAALDALTANFAAYDRPAATAEEERAQHVASLRFHAMLAEHADNPLLSFLIDFMASILSEITINRGLYAPPNPELWRKGREYQKRLVEALRDGDADAARETMAAHMDTANALMQVQEARAIQDFLAH